MCVHACVVCVRVDMFVCLLGALDHFHKEETPSPSASDRVPMYLCLAAVSMVETGVMEKLH